MDEIEENRVFRWRLQRPIRTQTRKLFLIDSMLETC